jgi:hypothetical protein
VAFVTPALLQLRSSRSCQRQFGSQETIYSSHFSCLRYVWATLAFSAFSFLVIASEIVRSHL